MTSTLGLECRHSAAVAKCSAHLDTTTQSTSVNPPAPQGGQGCRQPVCQTIGSERQGGPTEVARSPQLSLGQEHTDQGLSNELSKIACEVLTPDAVYAESGVRQ